MARVNQSKIIGNKGLGDQLRAARKRTGMSIEEVADRTRIRQEYIYAMESGDYNSFSSEVHIKGFLKNYAELLGMDTSKVLALYRREATEPPKRKSIIQTGKINLSALNTRKAVIFLLGVLVVGVVASYLGGQLSLVMQPPHLRLTSPEEISANYSGELIVSGDSISFSGETSAQTIVRMNAEPIPVLIDNTFSTEQIPLARDETTIVITATNQLGKTSSINLLITKEKPEQTGPEIPEN